MLKRYQAGMIAAVFWLYNAWNAYHVSKLVGYAPRGRWEWAQSLANARPHPWHDILVAWLIFAIATAGIYYFLRKVSRKVVWLLLYSVALVVLMHVPTDVGGVAIAKGQFPFNTFYRVSGIFCG